jgi:hypothetical protein
MIDFVTVAEEGVVADCVQFGYYVRTWRWNSREAERLGVLVSMRVLFMHCLKRVKYLKTTRSSTRNQVDVDPPPVLRVTVESRAVPILPSSF